MNSANDGDGVSSLGYILIVEDEFGMSRVISQWVLAGGWSVRTACTVKASLTALREPIDGAIIDLGLPDGSGFDVIDAARSMQRDVPVLVVTGDHDPGTINRAQCLGVEYACKPADAASVTSFLNRCRTANPARLSKLVADLVARHGLTPAQARLVNAAVQSTTRKDLCDKLKVSRNTVKAHVHDILSRAASASLEELVAPIRAAAFRR